jgi:tetratricopeptide (TPR) repeat protein
MLQRNLLHIPKPRHAERAFEDRPYRRRVGQRHVNRAVDARDERVVRAAVKLEVATRIKDRWSLPTRMTATCSPPRRRLERRRRVRALNLGLVSYGRGDLARAGERFSAALDAFDRVEFREHVANALHGLAAVAAAEGRYEDATRLFAPADPILREVGSEGFEPSLVARTRAEVEEALGTESFEAILHSAALNSPPP